MNRHCNKLHRTFRISRIALGLTLAVCMSAVDRSYFMGNWLNVNSGTRSLPAVQIGQQDGQYTMRTWGACQPTPCPWGMAKLSFYGSSVSSNDVTAASASYRQGFCVRRVTLRPGDNGTLVLEVMTHFTDNSGRADYTSVDTFRSVSWDQWDSNTYK